MKMGECGSTNDFANHLWIKKKVNGVQTPNAPPLQKKEIYIDPIFIDKKCPYKICFFWVLQGLQGNV